MFSFALNLLVLVVLPGVFSLLCGLNGDYDTATGRCVCDAGWRGPSCSEIALAPASPDAFGLYDSATPTWGGGAVFEKGHWHLIVGARDTRETNDTLTSYVCDSKIIRAVSVGTNPAGPYRIAQTLTPRSCWEPGLARGPRGELLVMFFGNFTNPPPVDSPACLTRVGYNFTNMNTYIMISESGSVLGPWTAPRLVKGMENRPRPGADPYNWRCVSGNPSPAWHPNGTLFAAMRHNPCWKRKGQYTREHIGLWRADDGWDGLWRPVSDQPIYGWGRGNVDNCTDENGCPSHEDPHLWWDKRGAHLLTHDQNNPLIHNDRGAYGWSLDGHNWTIETGPLISNASAWSPEIQWTNGSTSRLTRRQRPSFIRDVDTNEITHLINGADFNSHAPSGQPNFCEGCYWGSGLTLVQPVLRKNAKELETLVNLNS